MIQAIRYHWPAGTARDELLRIACKAEDPAGETAAIRDALRALADQDRCPGWLRRVAGTLAEGRWRDLKVELHADHPLKRNLYPGEDCEPEGTSAGGLVLLGSTRLLPERPAWSDTTTTEDDTASTADVPVPLDAHCREVAEAVDRDARVLGLPEPLRLALRAAALLHDVGKADDRFQALLHGGNHLAARLAPRLLAKSAGLSAGKDQRDRDLERSGWPRGGRHESLSLRLAEPLFAGIDAAVDRDLVLHLITAHHGHARPFVPFAEGLEPGQFSSEGALNRHLEPLVRKAVGGSGDGAYRPMDGLPGLHLLEGGVAERFWALVRRYGWWGLAWLEALLRLADHRVSARAPATEDDRP